MASDFLMMGLRDPPHFTQPSSLYTATDAQAFRCNPKAFRALAATARRINEGWKTQQTACSVPDDAQFRPRIGLLRGFDARRSSGWASGRAIGDVRLSSKLDG